jgi:hypothetical protein
MGSLLQNSFPNYNRPEDLFRSSWSRRIYRGLTRNKSVSLVSDKFLKQICTATDYIMQTTEFSITMKHSGSEKLYNCTSVTFRKRDTYNKMYELKWIKRYILLVASIHIWNWKTTITSLGYIQYSITECNKHTNRFSLGMDTHEVNPCTRVDVLRLRLWL